MPNKPKNWFTKPASGAKSLMNNKDEIDYSKLLEENTYRFGGIKALISTNHYTKEKFWKIYNKENLAKAKNRLDPNKIFPGLYEKFNKQITQ